MDGESEAVNSFSFGVAVGMQLMQDKIKTNHKRGKPVMVDNELYWLTDSREHLKDIMEHFGK